ncbi:polyprenyl synthetase family protein [Leeuwenhoekiella marinoflava]|uniref:Geranylgeranyl diphosphate synthase type II n=2 Tax=Leeuwenhoekiella marinoflava TaxID=988 RepID=A0A4Q0P6S7_9FLAO|nr:polyprenyl synthetase family protein [Leeuwenhoekiella marinoflava]RXG22370.1 geranylgeranyl diphosphate synthase type II [Leeuwenhoekiella marinoflava]SHF32324.1 geranylgeranyl diphosphate synthase, type II [Leeuwenhoekiella marinoflava DSM 3653]
MLRIDQYTEVFVEYLNSKIKEQEPKNLYDPINYILQLGGKRLRPVLTLMATAIFESDYKKALDAALAVEVFHNFSLVHDDIMDDAPLRRGQDTVHEKWDVNTGILSGDAMLINAYQLFENYEGETFRELAKLFSKTAIEVCEGQQYDVDFETRDDVRLPEYLKMIEYKTAVLVGAALKMGAIVAETTKTNCDRIYEFGRDLGIAFQLQDDYLDAFGDPKTFGKQVGGDIIENKKTFLYLTALEKLDPAQSVQLQHLFTISPQDPSEKVETVKQLFIESGASEAIQKEIESYTHRALKVLDELEVKEENKENLREFAQALMYRSV